MRKKISISETENDNFRLREIYNAHTTAAVGVVSISNSSEFVLCVCSNADDDDEHKNADVNKIEISLKSDLVVSS